ncbi:DUF6794 domain-containing protein [Hymenobacter cellulosivorans]|uniref:DUF6794 domain-containing protein n=1 Tax=Hymenobacter cellulosivorans TaxID=2932249 RepID=A0ABY4FAZ1_9BACT|nr:DUF6794 domain-containing protein [Hymenobacter cellulosivorans]UOQ53845.1 hypothetical protein MUN80_03565 [Hymenobacter cellulosivorans]
MLKNCLAILCVLGLLASAQAQPASVNQHGFYIPANLTEANEQLDKILSPKAKAHFKTLEPSNFEDINGIFLLNEWAKAPNGQPNRLERYLDTFIQPKPDLWRYDADQMRSYLIYLSYLRYLRNQPFDVSTEARKLNATADSLQRLSDLRHARHLTADSISGIYIPKNLPDAFRQLDQLLTDTVKQQLRHPDPEYGLSRFHFGLGLWMRNSWQLWGGSRLQQYFEAKGVTHPDDMSGILLDTYSQYLNGKAPDEAGIKALTQLVPPVVAPGPPPPPKLYYSKPYRKFLRRRRIDDFNSLPPEAYAEEVEIVKPPQ